MHLSRIYNTKLALVSPDKGILEFNCMGCMVEICKTSTWLAVCEEDFSGRPDFKEEIYSYYHTK